MQGAPRCCNISPALAARKAGQRRRRAQIQDKAALLITIDYDLRPDGLASKIDRLWELSARKIADLEKKWDDSRGSPVFTADGAYTARGWTDWTQGFRCGSAILQYDATGEPSFLETGLRNTRRLMPPHVTHTGVHDHGFNIISTYGNLRRLTLEDKLDAASGDLEMFELALKASGAVQAMRWTVTGPGTGYIYSFNGPHSLFADTIRSLRSLAVAHMLGHELLGEQDERISLLERLLQHADSTAQFTVYYGEGRDSYDMRGRVAHESIFNTKSGRYRCPSTQQGYSPFTTWTRGLAWVMLGYAEQLEFLAACCAEELARSSSSERGFPAYMKAATATCDFYIEQTPSDGIPYWDTGAPDLSLLGEYLGRPADPFNDYEPVDSSAAAIAAQGLLRLGRYLEFAGESEAGKRYWQAGLTVLRTLLDEPYLSTSETHQGLLLHSIYHRPNGWDHVPHGSKIPCGESSMWGDYHLREVALLLQRIIRNEPSYTFYGAANGGTSHGG